MTNNKNINTTSYESILKQASQQKRGNFKLSKTYPAFLILLIMILLSFFIWRTIDQSVKSDITASYDKATTSVLTRFDANYRSHQEVLASMRGLYDYLIQVVRDYFTLYGSVPTKTYSSIICLMSVPKVEKAKMSEYIHYVRSQGYYDYKIYPMGDREVFFPSEFVVPDTVNLQMKGFDFASDPVFVEEIERARNTNSVVATPVMNIRGKDTNAVYMISPIYKRGMPKDSEKDRLVNFDGMVVLELNLTRMLQNAIGKGETSDTTIIFECFYNNSDRKPIKVFESKNADLLKTKYIPYIATEQKLKIQNQEVTVKFYTIPNFGGAFQKALPLISLIVSLLISFVFFGFILSVITSRARAVDLAERMTRSQRRIVESSNDIIAVLGTDGVWKSMNPASIPILGYEPKDLIGNKIDILYADDEAGKEFAGVMNIKEDEYRKRFAIQMITKEGKLHWISWDVTVSNSEGLIYCIGRDVTLEKLAQEQERLKSKQVELAKQMTSEASESKSFFMTKLSHQLRNSLTSIIGYHQLLANKLYDTEEEHDSYIEIVNNSSEELFVFVSDMIEVSMVNESGTFKDLDVIPLETFKQDIFDKAKNEIGNIGEVNIELYNQGDLSSIFADKTLIENALLLICKSLAEFKDKVDLHINITDNPREGASEIQILSSPNETVTDLVEVFKKYSNNLIDSLQFDKNDVLLSLSIAASMLRMMNGTMTVDTFGKEEGNLVQITLPGNKLVEYH